jgi:hypothetical protein
MLLPSFFAPFVPFSALPAALFFQTKNAPDRLLYDSVRDDMMPRFHPVCRTHKRCSRSFFSPAQSPEAVECEFLMPLRFQPRRSVSFGRNPRVPFSPSPLVVRLLYGAYVRLSNKTQCSSL